MWRKRPSSRPESDVLNLVSAEVPVPACSLEADDGLEGVRFSRREGQCVGGVVDVEVVGDDRGHVDGAAGDEVEGEWVGVGVAEGAGDGELAALDEGDVDADVVGSHADQDHPT